jgi:hypothetical protein
METHIAQDLICPQMIRWAADYVALWTGHKLCIALGCKKFILLTFKSLFLTASTTYSTTKFKHLILKGERIAVFCENYGIKNKFWTRNGKFLYIEESGCKSFPLKGLSNYRHISYCSQLLTNIVNNNYALLIWC